MDAERCVWGDPLVSLLGVFIQCLVVIGLQSCLMILDSVWES